MAFWFKAWRPGIRPILIRTMLVAGLIAGFVAPPARAERSTFRIYNAEQGLTSLGGACMMQDRAGYMLVCTDHGVFVYDGRRFTNLGPEQGLPQGGLVFGLALTAAGRLVFQYDDEIFVSDHPSDALHPPVMLSFRKVPHPGLAFYDHRPHRVAAWRDGVALLVGDGDTRHVVVDGPEPRMEAMPYDVRERRLLSGAAAVFSVRGHLWEAFDDGRLCAADPGAVRCEGEADGLRGGPWISVVPGPGGQVIARSAAAVAMLDPATGRWTVSALPDQGGRYDGYHRDLGLFRMPDGTLATQAAHGLALLGPDGWRTLTVQDGAPAGAIMGGLTDANGQLWFQIFGVGLMRWIGYGHWEILQKAEGLSDDVAWQTARPPLGSLWVSTDTGINEGVRQGGLLRVARVVPGAAFVLAVDRQGRLWSSSGTDGVRVIEPATGAVRKLAVPPVDAIVPDFRGNVWIGTEAGLFRADDRPGAPLQAVPEGSGHAQVVDIAPDGSGGIFFLSAGKVWHRHEDGTEVPVGGAWPDGGFAPLVLASGHDGTLWVGGAGGLFRLVVSQDQVIGSWQVQASDTQTNTIVAVMVDRRGWVWAGTSFGVSVFNGRRWVSVNADGGLLSDDVSQGGIREDPDGSVWIATTQGVSHLLDPGWLFADRPLQVAVSQARLGSRTVSGASMPYTQEALSIQLGTPSYGDERSLLFRYRLSGVDAGWVESASGTVRYPFVPPGYHVLTVIGYDELTHAWSPPATLVVDVAFPWWRRWWAEGLWALAVVGLGYAALRLRLRVLMARQAELERRVAAATEEMRLAQATLRHQAAHDALTGLLNRSEIERRLASRLSGGRGRDEMLVALVDIDHFKLVNDRHGHLGGDDVLRAIGGMVADLLRDSEDAGRYGGEEILLVLDDSDGRGAERVLDLHLAIRRSRIEVGDTAIQVTCSIGLAWAVGGDDWESLVGRADAALYDAKAAGRDRVIESVRVPALPDLDRRAGTDRRRGPRIGER